MKNLELSLSFSEVEKEIKYKYSQKIITEFSNILDQEDTINIFLFIIKNNINLTDFGGDFSYISSLVNNVNPEDYDTFFKIKIIQDKLTFIKENLLVNKLFYIDFLRMVVKNKTRQKGSSHFAKKIKKEFSKYFNIEIIEKLSNFKLKNNTIYVSSSDKILTNILKLNNVKNIPKKGIDIILNINNNLSFGEVKEINQSGGSQNLQYENLENIANLNNGFGIIYGNILFHNNNIKEKVEKNPNIYTIWEFRDLIS